MPVHAAGVPLINRRGEKRSHIRLIADANEFQQNTQVKKVQPQTGSRFGFKQLSVDPANGILLLRITGKHTGQLIDVAPPSGPLSITFDNGPATPASITVIYVDDAEDTPDDPSDP